MRKEFKLFLIYLVLTFLFIFLLACEILTYIDLNTLKQLGVYFVKFVMFLSLYILCFVPTSLIIFFLFRVLKNKIFKILLISVLVPLTILIYYFFNDMQAWFLLLASVLMTVLMLFSVFIPKKILVIKKEIFITSILTFLLLLAETYTFLYMGNAKQEREILKDLSNYNLAIKYIKDYKLKNGIYPENIDFIKVESVHFPKMKYETFDDNKNFILKVYEYENYNTYNYCSDSKFKGCHEGIERPCQYTPLGDWIEMRNID